MKVAVYIRVSTTEQANEGYSIKAQKTKLNAFATSQDWQIVQYYVDEGISAKDMKRPELQRMIEGIKNQLFDCVLIYRLDRLTRSVVDLHDLLKTFEKYDVKFKSATESYDTTTATGRLFITLVASMAQWERENLGERVSFGMEEKAREGKWVIAIPPLGYDLKEDQLYINEKEATIVRKIFELYASGAYGQHALAREMNNNGHRTKNGTLFHGGTLRYILANPIYVGTMRYNYRVNKDNYFEIEDAAPQIIDDVLFERVQAIANTRAGSHPRRAASQYIFSGIVKCARCGTSMNGKVDTAKCQRGSGKKYYSFKYYCRKAQLGLCDQRNIVQTFMEAQFLAKIESWDLEKDIQAVKKISSKQTKKRDDSVVINKELKEIQKRIDKWQFAWVEDMLSDEEFQKRMNEERAKEESLKQKLNEVELVTSENHDLPTLLREIRENWNELTTLEKKQLVAITVKEMKADKIGFKRTPASVEVSDIVFN